MAPGVSISSFLQWMNLAGWTPARFSSGQVVGATVVGQAVRGDPNHYFPSQILHISTIQSKTCDSPRPITTNYRVAMNHLSSVGCYRQQLGRCARWFDHFWTNYWDCGHVS